ncbi:hypothetical protein AZE42_04264, partial [Rhizopogon vesiculosus]
CEGSEDEDVCVITVLCAFSDDTNSIDARPTQAQIDFASLPGSQVVSWLQGLTVVAYASFTFRIMPVSIEQMLQNLEISGSTPSRSSNGTLSIKQMLQNIQISVSSPLRSSAKAPQMNLQCPPKQNTRQHYGYRVEEPQMLYLESILKSDPSFDHDTFPNPMTYAFEWLLTELQLGQLDCKYCHDPERRPQVPLTEDVAHLESGRYYDDAEEDEDVFVILVLSVFSDDPKSFNARPRQAKIDLLTDLLGSPPQWWVGYKGWC